MSSAALAPQKHLRFACIRCHSMKLRCPRSSELGKWGIDEPCSRCRKARAACIVRERGKLGRPAKRKANPPTAAELAEVSHRHDHHRELGKSPFAGAGLNHVFGSIEPSLQQSELTPPESLDHSLQYDPDNMLSGSGSPARMPTQQQTWPNNDGTDHNQAEPKALYEPFPQDTDIDIDLPTFQFPEDTTDMFDLTGGVPVLKDKNGDHMFTNLFENALPNKTDTQKKPPALPPVSILDWSSTSCLLKLSGLSVRMLRSSEKHSSTAPASANSEASYGCKIVKETVNFSGELICVTRQTLWRIFTGSSRCSASAGTEASTPIDEDENDDCVHSAATSVDDWINVIPQSSPPSMPDSAVIFLLLGCYTQLLYSFELAIDCLYAEHNHSGSSSDITRGDNLGNINSRLEAALSIQTVIYLLGRVHKAFTVCEPENGNADGVHDDETNSRGIEGWKRSLMGNKSLDEGLLGRTFNEIQEREQRLMKKAQQLKQMINRSRI
ncbi:hypothetical protein EDB81DRAFT_668785 [Dactylonectria macrodidyma]|uniref:Zn(2)-C6 fungal-type domain-containing protein n=1 Tax=Dactylonectria macrodidyma TaxID=307937 RepID=A0A9P9DC81_9HYPO|nr:hypothetical protein EDB81DRAFT_668785 [Dactylonectria macrodidyma]